MMNLIWTGHSGMGIDPLVDNSVPAAELRRLAEARTQRGAVVAVRTVSVRTPVGHRTRRLLAGGAAPGTIFLTITLAHARIVGETMAYWASETTTAGCALPWRFGMGATSF